MKLVVLTPQETLLEEQELSKVRVLLADGGSLGIHPGHHPLLAETDSGPVEYGREAYRHQIGVRAGVLRVEGDRVMIYTSGLTEEEIHSQPAEMDRMEKTIQELKERLEEDA
jgi:F0F1-type ATP synthase epsilon subunit